MMRMMIDTISQIQKPLRPRFFFLQGSAHGLAQGSSLQTSFLQTSVAQTSFFSQTGAHSFLGFSGTQTGAQGFGQV